MTMDSIKKLLKDHGIKITEQRLLVVQILSESDTHINADTILERATKVDPKISLATIYRSLSTLKEANIIAARYYARDHKREYFVLADRDDQYHFTCVSCGEISVVKTPRIRQAKKELAESLGILFTHACLCFEGFCAECTSNPKNLKTSNSFPQIQTNF
jgi:Fe2+ or Zn2+ uptake regulation protein